MKILPLIIILTLLPFSKSDGQVVRAVEELAKSECFRQGTLHFNARDLNNNSDVLTFNESKLMAPASVQKLITTATALEVLGPDHQFITRFLFDKSDVVEYGTLDGALHIMASGDPGFLNGQGDDNTIEEFLDILSSAIEKMRIDCIHEGIVIHASDFDMQAIPDGWVWQDIGNYYGSGVHPINFAENTFTIRFKQKSAGREAEYMGMDPQIPFVVKSKVLCSGTKDEAYIYPTSSPDVIAVKGKIPPGKGVFRIKGSIPDPMGYFMEMLAIGLEERGISIGTGRKINWGKARALKDYRSVYEHRSRPLIELIRETNFESNNLFSEAFLLAVGLEQEGASTFQEGIKSVTDHWEERGVDMSNCRLMDGSGLSPQNRVSAQQVVAILASIYGDPAFRDLFLSTIPKAGVEGTVKNLMNPGNGNTNWYVKSGSMGGVRAYAGYIISDKRALAFCLSANDITCPGFRATNELKSLLKELP